MAFPEWIEEFANFQQSEIAHQYIFHGNVADSVYSEGAWAGASRYTPFREYLGEYLIQKLGCQIVLYYSLSAGLTTRHQQTEDILGALDGAPPLILETIADQFVPRAQNNAGQNNSSLRQVLLFLDQLLRQRQYPRVAVILEYLEKIAPHAGSGVLVQDERANIEMLQRWARDSGIRNQADHAIIGLTDSLGYVAPELYSSDSRCRAIRVPLPTEAEREKYLNIRIEAYQARTKQLRQAGNERPDLEIQLGTENPINTLAGRTKGFMLVQMDELLRRAANEHAGKVTPELVGELKREIIKTGSGGLLEEREPRHGFEAIGGHDHIKNYLTQVKGYLDAGHAELVPKGILLAGPPGTGKTLIAEALAKETGRNVVKMGNIRSMWVGESERNLTRALQLIVDVAPVIVFVDEIDQALGSRGTGQGGDSGVSERMFGKILEVMGSNEHRGRIIWVAATNRADVLDEAMLRRFDRVFPVLIPGSPTERLGITLAMAHQVENLNYESKTQAALIALSRSGTPPAGDDNIKHEAWQFGERTEGLTGSDLEIILRRAKELAGSQPVGVEHLQAALNSFKSNHHLDMYDLQTLLAVAVCNFVDMIPPSAAFPERLRKIVDQVLKDKHNKAIDRAVDEIKQRMGVKRTI